MSAPVNEPQHLRRGNKRPRFEIGDRVQHLDLLRQDGTVITGLRGTVIGVYRLTVKWDETHVHRARRASPHERVNFYPPEYLAPARLEGPEASPQ